MAPPRKPATRGRTRRRVRKNIAIGQAHIKTSFNNTIVSLTDGEGNVIAWESSGSAGFKGSRKSTPFAAQVTADACARKGMEHGLQKVEVFVKGPGSGRETAIRSLQAAGLEILGVKDVTPQAHNGVRLAGFKITVHPAARAAAIFLTASMSGKFQGLIAPTTPTGVLMIRWRFSSTW